nr:hypothetical protein [Tanacetum cinerariifolium]
MPSPFLYHTPTSSRTLENHLWYNKSWQTTRTEAEKALYNGCKKFTKLSFVVKLLDLKAKNNWSDNSFTTLLELLHEAFPEDNEFPVSTYQAKKLTCLMGLEVQRIHACPNDCILYRKAYKNLHECLVCMESRYKHKNLTELDSDVAKNGPPPKLLWYLPIIPRLKKLYANPKDAKLLRWHAEEHKNNGKMRHVTDSPQWKNIDQDRSMVEPMDGFAAFSQVADLDITFGKKVKAPPKLICKKRSIFLELKYWPHLHVRHCLDVMHIEKNVCESLLGLLLNIPGKTKDGVDAQKDMVEMGIRNELAPQVPSSYSANIKNLVSMKDLKLLGIKSHDCHVLLTQMILIVIRRLMPPPVRQTITKLCLFFNMIHSKVIDHEKLDELQHVIILILCQLEMYFPPSFFDIMVYLMSHIVEEIKLVGLIFLRYMYPFKRYMGFLKGYLRNRYRPEGSIVQGQVAISVWKIFRNSYQEANLYSEKALEASNKGRKNFLWSDIKVQATRELVQGSNESKARVDPLILVLGPEHEERTRGVGCDISSVLTEEKVACATTTVYPIGDGTVHFKKLLKGHMKVSVIKVVEIHKSMELPMLDDEIPNLESAVKFIEWLIAVITRFTQTTTNSSTKNMSSTKLLSLAVETSPMVVVGKEKAANRKSLEALEDEVVEGDLAITQWLKGLGEACDVAGKVGGKWCIVATVGLKSGKNGKVFGELAKLVPGVGRD